MNNFMSLRVYAKFGNEAFVRSCVAAFSAQINPTLDEINDIKTAVSEAVTNSIVHSNLSETDLITVEVSLKEKNIHISVIDEGVGIEDIEKAKQPFFTTKPNEERTGMGFSIMDAFMDSLEVLSNEGGKGVLVKMSKTIKG